MPYVDGCSVKAQSDQILCWVHIAIYATHYDLGARGYSSAGYINRGNKQFISMSTKSKILRSSTNNYIILVT